jgi:hypothetical protein
MSVCKVVQFLTFSPAGRLPPTFPSSSSLICVFCVTPYARKRTMHGTSKRLYRRRMRGVPATSTNYASLWSLLTVATTSMMS